MLEIDKNISLVTNRKKSRTETRRFIVKDLPVSVVTIGKYQGNKLPAIELQDCVLGEFVFQGPVDMQDGSLNDLIVSFRSNNRFCVLYFSSGQQVCVKVHLPLKTIQALQTVYRLGLAVSGKINVHLGIVSVSLVIAIPYKFESVSSISPIWNLLNEKTLSDNQSLPDVIIPTYPDSNDNYQHASISVDLYPYQKRAIRWLLYKEGVEVFKNMIRPIMVPRHPPVWIKMDDYYVNESTGIAVKGSVPDEPLGGILCDEMGMGKTLMIISLILLHPLPSNMPKSTSGHPLYSNMSESTLGDATLCKATLILTPKSILSQWIDEIKRNANTLKYTVYEGTEDESCILEDVDIVFSTYDVMKKELHLSNPGREGPRRKNRPYSRRKSFLMSRTWWRVVLDEAQMVESNVIAAALMARKIPRIHPWSVTGTPTPKAGSLNEMEGLFEFIGANVSCESVKSLPSEQYHQVLKHYIHKNTKDNVKSEMELPNQTETVHFVSFKAVETSYYDDLVEMSLKDIGPEPIAPPLLESVASVDADVIRTLKKAWKDYNDAQSLRESKMNTWLLRLRQTCCHPKVSTENRKLLGSRVESIGDVLSVMLEKTISSLATEERRLVLNSMNQCHLMEMKKEYDSAVTKYNNELTFVKKKLKELGVNLDQLEATNEQLEDDDQEVNEERVSQMKVRLKSWKELEHRLVFFIACAYHNKANDFETDNKELRDLEIEYYKKAATIREEMLAEYETEVEGAKTNLETEMNRTNSVFADTQLESFELYGGLVINEILDTTAEITTLLGRQLELLVDYRDELYQLLISDLDGNTDDDDKVDAEGNPTGEEYEKGIVVQDNAMIYQDEMRYLLVHRKKLLGIEIQYPEASSRIMNEKLAKELRMQRLVYSPELGSLKGCQQRLRAILNEYQSDDVEMPDYMPMPERGLAMQAIAKINSLVDANNKIIAALDKDMTAFSDLFNERVKYYTQLNKISDGVVMPEWDEDLDTVQEKLVNEQSDIQSNIAKILGRKRYFEYLQRETNQSDTEQQCGSCHIEFERGVLTACGHWFCGDCTKTWIASRRRCPMCTQHIDMEELVHISFKRKKRSHTSRKGLELIRHIKINGSHGTKIDAILKHILYIRRETPEAKILCFSQWKAMLDIFGNSLMENNIGFIALEGQGWDPVLNKKLNFKKQGQAVVQFKENPNITVFMLNAKSQSSGLTLVAATHIFLIEPVIHKGLELQAINRVHRIGQSKETFVWRYLIEDTVEELLVQVGDNFVNVPLVQGKDRGELIHQETLKELFQTLKDQQSKNDYLQ